jgi:hypothetical protein
MQGMLKCSQISLQPCHVARPAAVPAGHPSGSTLPPVAAPVQHPPQACAAMLRAALAGGRGALGTRRSRRGGRWGGCGRRGSAKMPFESPIRPFESPSMLPLLSSPLAYFFFPPFFGHCAPSPRAVWRLPVALGPLVSNDLLSVRAQTPVTRFSMRLSTRAGRPVGGDPIYTTACLAGPEIQRVASTSTKAEA